MKTLKVECIEKPLRKELTTTDITVGNTYTVINQKPFFYNIIDDDLNERWYNVAFFKIVEDHVSQFKLVKERDDLDLLELVCQLHSRALAYPSKEMHDSYMEARTELENRLKQYSHNNF